MKTYLFAFFILVFQMYVAKFFSIWGIVPDFLTIFIVILTLKNTVLNSLKIAVFISVLQDLISPISFPINTITKGFIVLFVSSVKQRFYYSSGTVKFFLILIVTTVDVCFKGFITYVSTGVMDFMYIYPVSILINFLTFYVVSIFYEIR